MNTNKTTIAFVSLPSRATSVVIPIAYIYLAAWLEKKGISSEIIDIKRVSRPGGIPIFSIQKTLERILSEIESKKPKYVGFTCYTADFSSITKIGRLIKEKINTKIIVGGIHPTIKPEDFFSEGSPVDIAVIGEGEVTLSELIEKDLSGLDLINIPGIIYRKGKDIIRTIDRQYMENLGDLPLPAYNKIDMDFYTIPKQALTRTLFLSGVRIFTARGCPYLCTFCANRAQKVRYRPIKAVIEEIVFLKNNYDIDGFYINDDTFCIDRKRTFEFLDELKRNKLNMVWGIETRVGLLDYEMVASLKKAGCIQIDIGVESGSQDMLDRVKKGIRIENVVKTFEICRLNRMRTLACFMVNLPGETEDHINKSIDLMKKIKATLYGINITLPHIGTQIYEDYVKPKLTPDEYDKFMHDNSFKPLEDKRFRLVNHDINEKYIYYMKFKRFGVLRLFIDITLDPMYWKMLIRSKKRLSYVKQFLIITFYKIFIYPVKLLKTINFKTYE